MAINIKNRTDRKKYINEKIERILESWNPLYLDEIMVQLIGDEELTNDKFYSKEEKEFIRTALMHCIAYHSRTKRVSGDYYAVHGIETARILDIVSKTVEKRGDVVKIAAALLHDTVEERADRLNFRIETYNENLAKLLDETRQSLYEFARNFRFYKEFENDLRDTMDVVISVTRTPDKDYYEYLDELYFPEQNGFIEKLIRKFIGFSDKKLTKEEMEGIVKKRVQVKNADRIDNTRDLFVFSDHHRNYSVYKNFHVIHRTRKKYYNAEPKTSDDFAIQILDVGLKGACLNAEDEIISRLRPIVGEKHYDDFISELMEYIKTPNFRKVTKSVKSEMGETVYTYDGTAYRFNEYLHEKKTIRQEKGIDDSQVLRDSLLMRAIAWGYILDPRFRVEGFEKIGGNGHNGH